jgi:undecaprenyl-diphosphatase
MTALSYKDAGVIGLAQSTALIAGISRDGICMTTTPIILAAGIFKLSDLTGPLGAGIGGQAVVAAVCAALAAIAAVHWLLRYFRNNNLTPFGIYCLVFGFAMVIYTTA